MKTVLASEDDWDQSEGGLQQVSFIDSVEEHTFSYEEK